MRDVLYGMAGDNKDDDDFDKIQIEDAGKTQ